MKKTAIILGATGLTGNLLLQKLINDERYELVKIFSRKPIEIKHPKVIEVIGNLLELETFNKDFTADEVFCSIGTTAKKTPDKELYKKIDIGIPLSAAKLCKENNINTFIVMSSLGADAKSSVFYNKIKGEMEQSVLKEGITNTYILRPSIILGKRNENRIFEGIGKTMFTVFQFLFIGKLKRYKAIEADNIAKAMIYLANSKPDIDIIESDKIGDFAFR
ncbi:MAG: NAD(P)H-binding protein [Bacteroidota bacterium]